MMPRTFSATWLQAALAALALASVMALAGSVLGYRIGHQGAADAGEAKLQALKAEHAKTDAAATAERLQQERAMVRFANQAGAQLLAERSLHDQEVQQLKGRIARVTNQYRPAPDAPLQPAPRCVFTNGFVGVWNAAIGAGTGVGELPSSVAPGGTDGSASADEALDSGVRPADVLAHHADYGQRCRGIESQLNRLLDVIEGTP
jgi:hypothetical protein